MKNWQVKTLQDICEKITDGTHQTPTYYDEGFVFLSSKNVTSGKIDWKKIKYIDEKQHIELYKRVSPKRGDILLAKNGTTGVAAIVDRDIIFDIYVSLAWLRSKGDVTSEYLWYFINSPIAKKQFNSRLKGIGVPNLHLKEIKEVQIPFPKIQEQQFIVAKLDQAFTGIDQAKANIEKNIQNAKELFQSKLNQIFSQKGDGWEELFLTDISKEFGRGKSKHRPRNWDGLYNGKYPFVQTGNIRNATKYVTEFTQTYNDTGLAQSKLWNKGTICITIAANIAETAILNFDACFPDSIIGLNVDVKKANTNFVYYLLQYYKTELQGLSKGFAQQNINLGTFENKKFSFPKSLEQQQQIVNHLDELQEQTNVLATKYQQKLANLEELKKSILEKAFKGELVN